MGIIYNSSNGGSVHVNGGSVHVNGGSAYAGGGSVHVSNGNVFVNGQPAGKTLKQMNLNERKAVPFTGTSTIRVDSTLADVRFFRINEENMMAHLHGSAQLEHPIKLQLQKQGPVVAVSAKYVGSSSTNGLFLDIFVPNRLINSISINSSSGSIELGNAIQANQVDIKTASGGVRIESKSKVINASTMSGGINVSLQTGIASNVTLASMSGSIMVDAARIPTIQFQGGSQSGQVILNHKKRAGMTAYVIANTMSGSIIVS